MRPEMTFSENAQFLCVVSFREKKLLKQLKEEGLVYFFVTVNTLRLMFLEDFLLENTINK